MPRYITVGAAQMGPVGRNESRAAVVVRLLELMREAKARGCDLVVFTECALTPFFPRFWVEQLEECEQWFERELPGPGTHLLFSEAKKLGIGFHLGYAELTQENGETRRYNSSVLVGPDGQVIGKYRKIHLPGITQQDGENPHRVYEKRYFNVGNLGLRAWKAFGGAIGMCLGNDRRWPETYRVLGLYGAEMIILGYNTAADHPDHPELDHLTNFHSLLTMQAGAYQNGCFVVGVAKAGKQEGINQIGRSAIISPSGEVVTQCTTLGDELVVHRCNLDQTRLYKDHIFNFAHRQIEAYGPITQTREAYPTCEPGDIAPVVAPASATKPVAPAAAKAPVVPAARHSGDKSIESLFIDDYDYPPEQAQVLADRAKQAEELKQETASPQEPVPASRPKPDRTVSADPLEAIREVFKNEYNYSEEQLAFLTEQAARALELNDKPAEAPAAPRKPEKPATTISAPSKPLTQAAAKPLTKVDAEPPTKAEMPKPLPVADDIGWLPGRFAQSAGETPDRAGLMMARLMKEYRYNEEQARTIVELAEKTWLHMHPESSPAAPETAEAPPDSAEPPPTSVYIPEEHPAIETPGSKPLTIHSTKSPMDHTAPALSSEDAFFIYSVFTEKYGYSGRAARVIAERAHSANRRWQNSKAEAQPDTKAVPPLVKTESKKPQTQVPTAPPTKAAPPADPVVKPAVDSEKAVAPVTPREDSLVVVPCPECEFPMKISQANLGLLGRKARCPNCQTKFRLPESVQ